MRSLIESILAGKDVAIARNKQLADNFKCLANFILYNSGSSYGPASDFDLFDLIDSRAVGADAKKFMDNRLDVKLDTNFFSKYRIGRNHSSSLNSWLFKCLVLIIIYSKFNHPISEATIDKDLENLSNYLTKKYGTRGRIKIFYRKGKDILDVANTTGRLNIHVETNPDRPKRDGEGPVILTDCSITYLLNLNK